MVCYWWAPKEMSCCAGIDNWVDGILGAGVRNSRLTNDTRGGDVYCLSRTKGADGTVEAMYCGLPIALRRVRHRDLLAEAKSRGVVVRAKIRGARRGLGRQRRTQTPPRAGASGARARGRVRGSGQGRSTPTRIPERSIDRCTGGDFLMCGVVPNQPEALLRSRLPPGGAAHPPSAIRCTRAGM